MAQAPDSSVPVRMVVDLTVDDYAAFTAYAYQRPALRRRHASHLRFAVLLAAGLLAVILLRVWDGRQLDWGAALPAYAQALAVGLAVFALLAAGYEYALPRLARGNVRRALGRQPDNPFLGRHTLDFGPRGVDDAPPAPAVPCHGRRWARSRKPPAICICSSVRCKA